jgi:hypothetical protein
VLYVGVLRSKGGCTCANTSAGQRPDAATWWAQTAAFPSKRFACMNFNFAPSGCNRRLVRELMHVNADPRPGAIVSAALVISYSFRGVSHGLQINSTRNTSCNGAASAAQP